MSEKRRACTKCKLNRAERFYVSAKGRVCSTCRRRRTVHASRDVRLKELYDITVDEYNALLAAQNGRCAICEGKRPGSLDVDHDHAMVKAGLPVRQTVRGLLCRRCNRRLLPASLDSTYILMRAMKYLQDPQAQHILNRAA